jgi:mycoredoxin
MPILVRLCTPSTFSRTAQNRINPRVEPRLIRRLAHTGGMADIDIVMYARPGCPFCTMLRADLASAGIAYRERDIWQDADAAADVRAAANGNETVPTVNIGETWLVNPSVDEIRNVLRKAA